MVSGRDQRWLIRPDFAINAHCNFPWRKSITRLRDIFGFIGNPERGVQPDQINEIAAPVNPLLGIPWRLATLGNDQNGSTPDIPTPPQYSTNLKQRGCPQFSWHHPNDEKSRGWKARNDMKQTEFPRRWYTYIDIKNSFLTLSSGHTRGIYTKRWDRRSDGY